MRPIDDFADTYKETKKVAAEAKTLYQEQLHEPLSLLYEYEILRLEAFENIAHNTVNDAQA
jgi:hypothetical protein